MYVKQFVQHYNRNDLVVVLPTNR